ncbi:MAG: hypothetical protein PVG65_00070 [Candidatus Thorarchaeota archaeon]|jgi:hypothetical protein
MSREIIHNIPKNIKPFSKYYTVFKSTKKGKTSFRITRQLLQSLVNKAKKIHKIGELVITIPANKQENYILRGIVTKEKK